MLCNLKKSWCPFIQTFNFYKDNFTFVHAKAVFISDRMSVVHC